MADSGFDVVVVGAGVVGLACAASLARAGRAVLVLERHDAIAREATSRNSEVIHSGLYYPAGSLKAALCTEGREQLYRRCEAWRIPARKLGKLIVATTEAEAEELVELEQRGRGNGVPGLRALDAAEVTRLEPAVRACAGLLSPETGIVDAHALALSYLAEAEQCGAALALGREVTEVTPRAGGYALVAQPIAGGPAESIVCAAVVNAAGLDADSLAARAGLDIDAIGYRQHGCKGDYFALAPGCTVALSHLVYPVPRGPGLGVHATLDLGGRIRFGPDAEYIERRSYEVDPAKAEVFAEAVSRYLPAVRSDWLLPDYAGIRSKLSGPGQPFRDFVVEEESGRGLPGWVDCLGIESPGLTSAGAIADRVAMLLASL